MGGAVRRYPQVARRRSAPPLVGRGRARLRAAGLPGEQRAGDHAVSGRARRRLRLVRLAAGVCSVVLVGLVVLLALAPRLDSSPTAGLDRREWLLVLVGFAVAILAIRRLVGELRHAVSQVELLSRTDQLTGVANRWAWDDELRREMARARRDRTSLTVALVDVDRLDAFNQLRGHAEGDRLLQRLAQTWRETLRDSDMLARCAGGQFAVLLRRCDVADATAIVERLRRAVPDDQTASAGIVRWNGSDTAEELMRRAEEVLAAAKQSGRDRTRVAETRASSDSGVEATRWNQVVEQLLEQRSVVAVYQPVVDLSNGGIVAFEALARPDRAYVDISVEKMFSTAQRMGVGRDLDWLCRRAAFAGAGWLPAGIPLFVNCNVSALVDPVHRVDQMLLVLQACGRSPRDVVLEITERELVGDLTRLKSVVSSYRREGFRFAVDDVGEGHSTLEVLAATSPDFVKVARSLVVDAATAGPRAAIRAVVAFAGELGAYTIAEGIETESTATFMRRLGVHLAQGWLFGRPELPPASAPQTVLSRTMAGVR